MAHEIRVHGQSKAEIRTWFLEFAKDLPSGVTLATPVAIHVPPAGGAITAPTAVVSGTQVWVTFGPVDIVGNHEVWITVDLSDGEKFQVKLIVPVNF